MGIIGRDDNMDEDCPPYANTVLEMEEFYRGEVAAWRVHLFARRPESIYPSAIMAHVQIWRPTDTMGIPTAVTLN